MIEVSKLIFSFSRGVRIRIAAAESEESAEGEKLSSEERKEKSLIVKQGEKRGITRFSGASFEMSRRWRVLK